MATVLPYLRTVRRVSESFCKRDFAQFNAYVISIAGSGKTHTMLGPNPRRAGMATASSTMPSPSSEVPPRTAANTLQTDGLMVKAIDEIFRHVEMNDEPNSFKVNGRGLAKRSLKWAAFFHSWSAYKRFIM